MKRAAVRGHDLPSPRPTLWGVLYLLRHVGLPLLGGLLALDGVLYLVFTRLLGRCYGVLCLLR